jgi:large subunit ribosomal protein L29
MQAKELVEISVEELRIRERELREELCRLRLRKGSTQSENPMKIRNARKDLARILTVLRARQGDDEKGTVRS